MQTLHEVNTIGKDKHDLHLELFQMLDAAFKTLKEKKEGTILLKGIGSSLMTYLETTREEMDYKEFIYTFFFNINVESNTVLGFIKDQLTMMIGTPTFTLIDEIEISLIDESESDALARITWMKFME